MTARGGMGAASRAVGAPFVTVAGTRVCSDVVLQSLDFRKALNTIGSGNVRDRQRMRTAVNARGLTSGFGPSLF